MNKVFFKRILPALILFSFINALAIVFKPFLQAHGFNVMVLLAGNALLFLISVFGSFIQTKNFRATSTNVFLRGIYTSLLIKIFGVMLVIGAYLFKTGGKINIPSLLTLMALYIVYTTMEVKQMLKLYRSKPHA